MNFLQVSLVLPVQVSPFAIFLGAHDLPTQAASPTNLPPTHCSESSCWRTANSQEM